MQVRWTRPTFGTFACLLMLSALAVVYSDRAGGRLDRAAGRMERYVGSARLEEAIAKRWSTAATEVVRLHLPDPKIRGEWLQRAEQILEAVEAIDHAQQLHATLGLSISLRLATFGPHLPYHYCLRQRRSHRDTKLVSTSSE